MSPLRQSTHLVCQQQVPDLSQVLLSEDKAHITLNVWQQPMEMDMLSI